MADLEILSPITQSILQWNTSCHDESVDNFDLSMSMGGNGQENGDGFMTVDHTFHTPSFGDEEFDIPPINLPPTTPGSDTSSSDVYGSTQPLSHPDQPTPPQQQPQQQQQQHASPANQQQQHVTQQQQQQHLMSPPPPSPCSQSGGLDRTGTVTTTPSPPTMMASYPGSPHLQHHQQQPQHVTHPHLQQQQHQYTHPSDMYMLQLAPPGSMMPPQSVQFHVQQYAIPTSYSNGLPMQQQQHLSMGGHHHHPHMGLPQQLLPPSPMMRPHQAPLMRPASVGSSPPGSNHTSPGLETSEDSDDSGHLSQLLCGMKRPSPEPIERPPSVGKPPKKPKVQKKKKKRDPNEPQKPVSAYALFFRDTQAAIKGQNPNASFGEVSKIVASMWDTLDLDHKNVYKKKTEAAKKEYLKALAAYRASLVSKAAIDQPDGGSMYGGNSGGSQSLSPLQKKSPLLTSLMEGAPLPHQQPQHGLMMGQNSMSGPVHHQHMQQHPMLHQMLSPQQQMLQPQHMMQQQPQQMATLNNNNNLPYTPNMSPQQLAHPQHQQLQQGGQNPCRDPQEWDGREYCASDCVVSHCRDVFTTWVGGRPQQNTYASVK